LIIQRCSASRRLVHALTDTLTILIDHSNIIRATKLPTHCSASPPLILLPALAVCTATDCEAVCVVTEWVVVAPDAVEKTSCELPEGVVVLVALDELVDVEEDVDDKVEVEVVEVKDAAEYDTEEDDEEDVEDAVSCPPGYVPTEETSSTQGCPSTQQMASPLLSRAQYSPASQW